MRAVRRRTCAAGDEGFSLIEITVSLVVIMITLSALVSVYVSVAATAGLARQRQQATALGTQALESMRALPYATLTQGLANWGTELNDPNISNGRFRPTYNTSIDELLQTYTPAAAPTGAPMYPHITTVTENNVAYTVSQYVSQVTGSSPQAYWLTAIVSWSSGATKGVTKIFAVRSQLFSPAGCLDLKTHPFSGPCQGFLYSSGGVAPGNIALASATAGTPLFSGLTVTNASLILAELSSTMQSEQTTSVGGRTSTSGGSMALTDGTKPITGDLSTTSLTDNDPSTTSSGTFNDASKTQSASPLVNTQGNSALTLNATQADAGGTVGTLAAAASPVCADVNGSAYSTGMPCGSGSMATASGSSSSVLDFGSIEGRRLSTTIASVAAGSTQKTLATRLTLPDTTYCPSASGDGCAVSSVKRSLGSVMLGGLPAGGAGDSLSSPGLASATSLSGSGFAGLVTLSSYADSGTAVAGTGAAASTATRSGTLSYWDPAHCASGYCSISLSTAAASATSGATATYVLSDGATITVAMTATITVPAAAPTAGGSAPCQSAPCTVTTSVAPPQVSINYVITKGATSLGQFTLTADLGSVVAKASYRKASSV
jgi:Tfp pilus assembly protein PilV